MSLRVAVVYDEIAYGAHRAQLNWSDPDATPAGLTGTDLIACKYAEHLARRGHTVSVYCYGASPTQGPGGFSVHPLERLEGHLRDYSFDVALAVSSPNELARFPSSTLRLVNRQVARFDKPDCPDGFDDHVDAYLCPSEAARDHVLGHMPAWSGSRRGEGKFEVLPNGCEPSHFGREKKVPGRVVYCSSPDRGLHLLLQAWPSIRARVPHATLRVMYQSLRSWVAYHTDPAKRETSAVGRECEARAAYVKAALPRLAPLSVEVVATGMSHCALEAELDRAVVLGFPVDTLSFTETFSVATLEACAAGALPVVTDCDAIGQIYGDSGAIILKHPVRERLGEFTDAVIAALTDDAFRESRIAKTRGFAAEHSWERLAERLEGIVERRRAMRPEMKCLPQWALDFQEGRSSPKFVGDIASAYNVVDPFSLETLRKPRVDLLLAPYASGNVPIDLGDDLSSSEGGGCRAGFVGLARALAKRGEYEVNAFSTFAHPQERDGVSWRAWGAYDRRERRDVILAYYQTEPLVGVEGCLRIASHHTFQLPSPGAVEWTDVNLAPCLDAVDKLRAVYDSTAPWYVLPNAVGDMPVEWRPVPGRVVYHASASRGLHHLVEVWPEILRRVPEATLHVIGDVAGWLETFKGRKCRQGERAKRLRAALGGYSSVRLLGKLPRRDLLRELGEASCFAFPCDPIAPCETFSVSVMECLKVGLPVVLRPADSLASIYGAQTGNVLVSDLNDFASNVALVLLNSDLQALLSDFGKTLADRYTFDATAEVLSGILQRHLMRVA